MDLKTDTVIKRDRNGRFGGAGAYAVSVPARETRFTPLAEAENQLSQALQAADFVLKEAPRDGDGVPTAIVRASPGSGKSTGQRKLMAAWAAAGDPRLVAFHVPTLSLAEEAALGSAALGLPAQAIRGRSAMRPDGHGTMCEKAKTVERASQLGISVKENFCERRDGDGNVARCPHFEGCAYLEQFKDQTSQRFLATTYFKLPNPDKAKPDQRVADETFWQGFVQSLDIEAETFRSPRANLPRAKNGPQADLLQAAKNVLASLENGNGPMSLEYSADDYRAFARLEREATSKIPDLAPDQDIGTQSALLDKVERNHRMSIRLAALWDVLADAKASALDKCERLRLYHKKQKPVLRVLRKKPLPHSEPLLVLDADADPAILSALGCEIIHESELFLRPNAIIQQVHDRRMPTTTLRESPTIREEWRRIITREVLRDRLGPNSGVLVGASKQVVQAFFEDAGYVFEGMTEAQANEVMLNTDLHGASWTWFGGRSLGVNRYEQYSCVVVIGREEIPIHDLEDKGRALWGDTVEDPLLLVETDMAGQQKLPEFEIPYETTNGSAKAVKVPCHPDRRIRRLQFQVREAASRQIIERLRLARAVQPKRVIIGCNMPLPGLPVDALVSWQDLCVPRLDSAIFTGLLRTNNFRLTYAGLTRAAPTVFETEDGAKKYMNRNPAKKALFLKLKAGMTQNTKRLELSLEEIKSNSLCGQFKTLLSI